MPTYQVPYAPSQILVPNGRLVDLLRASGQDTSRLLENQGNIQAQMWGNVGNAIQSGVGDILRQQQLAPQLELEKMRVAKAKQDAADVATMDQAYAPRFEGDDASTPRPPTRDEILSAVPGHMKSVVTAQLDQDEARTASVKKAKDELASANAAKLSGLALSIKQHDYDPSAVQIALHSALQTYQDDPAMAGQIQRVAATLGQNPSRDVIQRVVDSIPLTKSDQETFTKQVGESKKGLSQAGLAAFAHLQGEGGTPQGARDILTKRLTDGISSGDILPGVGNAALSTLQQSPDEAFPTVFGQFITPEDKAAFEQKQAETKKNLAEAAKANAEAVAGKTKPLDQQLLEAIASGDTTKANQIRQSWATEAAAKRDPVAQGQLEALRNITAQAAQARLDEMDTGSEKNQQKFEQQYRTVLQRGLSSRSGGLGLEDAKVQQANHLISLLDQNFDPKTGQWSIPRVQLNELALGLARLVSPGGQAGEQMLKEFQQRTAAGDVAGALTYLTGQPIAANTQAITKYLQESILRQGQTAEQNREGEMQYLRGLAPTDLNEDRRKKLEANSLNPLRQSRIAVDDKGNRKLVVSIDGGKTWK